MERAEALRRESEDSFIRALELLYLSTIRVENILDFGCGLGLTVQLLREKLGLNAVGVDLSADFVETDYLHRCDLETLSGKYPPGHFDAIYTIEVFEHLEHPGRILSLLGALLKPQGKILINTSTREYLDKYDPERDYIDPLRRGHISIYSLKSLAHLATSIGRNAEFLGDRKYEVILSPADGQPAYPHPENIAHIRRLGDWCPVFLREYMRLVFLEREFETRSAWAAKLQKVVETLSPGAQHSPPKMPFWKKLWRGTTRRRTTII
ncbi:MAG: class I SAM-dependent methyltransferase [Acidobacteriia bacterium]|nr:class I SAM-dependent methyltransferase [Terriglobia bacterium]